MRARLAIGLVMAAFAATNPARAETMGEYQVKAAFVLNFAAATQWPPPIDRPLQLCVLGQAAFDAMTRPLDRKLVAGRPVAARALRNRESPAGCDVVFVAREQATSIPRLIEEVDGAPVLTIAESPGMAQRGIMINLVFAGEQIAFEISQTAVRKTPLSLSSKLLRLAVAIH